MQKIEFYLKDVSRLIAELPAAQLEGMVQRLLAAYDEGRQLFVLGNGGSAATASHLVNDFQKCIYLAGGKPFRAMAVTDNIPLITAWANDTDYENVFAEQLRPWVQPGDLVLAISGSGNSPNVLRAVELSRSLGGYTIGLAGFAGGRLKELVDECLVVPCDNMQRIEDCHMVAGHVLFWRMMEALEERKATAGAAR